jgi:hypothetical protein
MVDVELSEQTVGVSNRDNRGALTVNTRLDCA